MVRNKRVRVYRYLENMACLCQFVTLESVLIMPGLRARNQPLVNTVFKTTISREPGLQAHHLTRIKDGSYQYKSLVNSKILFEIQLQANSQVPRWPKKMLAPTIRKVRPADFLPRLFFQ